MIEILFCLQDGKTALLHATEKGHTQIVKELLDAGANTEVTNKVTYGIIVIFGNGCRFCIFVLILLIA